MDNDDSNPYEPPRAVLEAKSLDTAAVDLTDAEITAFAGRKASYYLSKWPVAFKMTDDRVGMSQVAIPQGGRARGFNWAAFFLSGLWLPYRKMYVAAGILYGIVLFESLVEEVVFVGILGRPEAPAALSRIVTVIVSIVCGSYGNQWYLSHTRRAVAEIRSQALPAEDYLQALSRRGGTNIAASLAFFVAFVAAIFAIFFLLQFVLPEG
jgi:hypothetical protein